MGTVGNPMNLINIVIAENEEKSPLPPFSVRKGFKKGENIVSLFEGWGVLSAANWKANAWGSEMNYPQIIKGHLRPAGHVVRIVRGTEPADRQFRQGCGFRDAGGF